MKITSSFAAFLLMASSSTAYRIAVLVPENYQYIQQP